MTDSEQTQWEDIESEFENKKSKEEKESDIQTDDFQENNMITETEDTLEVEDKDTDKDDSIISSKNQILVKQIFSEVSENDSESEFSDRGISTKIDDVLPGQEFGPTQLGYMGLSLGAAVISFSNFGVSGSAVFEAQGLLFIPSILLLIAALLNLKNNDTLEASMFILYSLLWSGLASSWSSKLWDNSSRLVDGEMRIMGAFLVGFLFFSFFFMLFSLQVNKVVFFTIFSLDLAIFFLIFRLIYGSPAVLAGVPFFMVAILSFYISISYVLNGLIGKEVFEMGDPIYNWSNFHFNFKFDN
ncbi:inner membrane protein yaah [Anaeramoeba ignava]|uniref:Inner membrane protein yaah n=1 Tax=Anaeramoeba ignava TaxID=1746090 RepID=A0A9Q0REC5_ANAIG|nr:inner membrane protein yaah [Anaeramoeba ignava]|eukprot:Anaeramoba_ignava/a1278_38.p1 GENE.a1278_38~~a1278_38.p1  ORF type:complete len:300 (-),score=101.42 a1278_38:146-1045(-)